jgi:hypothetical protein
MKTATITHKTQGDNLHASIVRNDGLHHVYYSDGTRSAKLGTMLDRHVVSPNGLAHFLREHPLVQGFEVNP